MNPPLAPWAEQLAHQLAWAALATGAHHALNITTPAPDWDGPKPAPHVVEHARWLVRGQQVEPLFDHALHRWAWLAATPRNGQHMARTLQMRRTRDRVHGALNAAGVQHLFFKGAAVEGWLWRGGGWRGALDVDVLVTPRQAAVAQGVLVGLGYTPEHPVGRSFSQRASKESVFTHAQLGPVDLHVRPLNAPFHADSAALLARTILPQQTDGARVPVPCPEDLLWMLAGNLAGDRFIPRFKLALDALALSQLPLDWLTVAARAHHAGCAWALWALLHLVVHRLGGAVPSEVFEQLAPPKALRPHLLNLAGVTGVPPKVQPRWLRVFVLDWPWSQRWWFGPTAALRWGGLRAADVLAAQRSGS